MLFIDLNMLSVIIEVPTVFSVGYLKKWVAKSVGRGDVQYQGEGFRLENP